MKESVKIVLPEYFDIVTGDTFQLFYRGVIRAVNPYNYNIEIVCKNGDIFPRYFEFTPQNAGVYDMKMSVYDNDGVLLDIACTQLRAYDVKHSPQNPVNILCMGDSLTEPGIWVSEANRRLTSSDGQPCGNGLTGFNFIGTCKRDSVGYEGHGGWRWENYLDGSCSDVPAMWVHTHHEKTDADQHSIWQDENGAMWQLETITPVDLKFNRVNGHTLPKSPDETLLTHVRGASHTEKIYIDGSTDDVPNPFADPQTQTVDLKSYCKRNGFEGIDAVYALLTWNGMVGLTIEQICSNCVLRGKQFADILHKQYPAAKLKIMGLQVPSVTGGCGKNYKSSQYPYCNSYFLTRLVLELNRSYQAWSQEQEYRDFVEFINISAQFDTEWNMPYFEKAVNNRSSCKEIVGNNGLHPSHEGYLQIADAVYRNIIAEFCN